MKIKLLLFVFFTLLALSGCTSSMATAYGGSLAGAAIQSNNEYYSESK